MSRLAFNKNREVVRLSELEKPRCEDCELLAAVIMSSEADYTAMNRALEKADQAECERLLSVDKTLAVIKIKVIGPFFSS